MRILISTGIYPPDIGGPARYAKNLNDELKRRGYDVDVIFFSFEKKLPSGARHLLFALRAFFKVLSCDAALIFDTMGAGFPTVFLAWLFKKKTVIRIGGDFLWEMYVERTRDAVPLDAFYADESRKAKLTGKERAIFRFTKFTLDHADKLVFTTRWQRDIWAAAYGIDPGKIEIVENFIGEKLPSAAPERKNFVWAGRPVFLKNVDFLKKTFEAARLEDPGIALECLSVPYEELQARLATCYAIIVPSISEISPNIVLDAMRYDKPFILTSHNGYKDLLSDCGIFVEPGDGEGMREKILWLSDAQNYQLQRERVARFTRTHSWLQITDEYLDILKKA